MIGFLLYLNSKLRTKKKGLIQEGGGALSKYEYFIFLLENEIFRYSSYLNSKNHTKKEGLIKDGGLIIIYNGTALTYLMIDEIRKVPIQKFYKPVPFQGIKAPFVHFPSLSLRI